MQKFLTTTALAGVLALGVIGGAAATPLSGTFNVTVYNFTNTDTGNGSAASEQALPGAQNSATASGLTQATFTYTGALNFLLPSGATDTVAAFIASGSGVVSGLTGTLNTTLSTSNFGVTSLFKFSFSTGAISGGITHDDGISLYAAANTTTNLLPGASAPTAASTTSYSLAAGNYDLYYTEANGLPATLNFNVVPEPATLALFGTGLAGLGLLGRRRFGGGRSV